MPHEGGGFTFLEQNKNSKGHKVSTTNKNGIVLRGEKSSSENCLGKGFGLFHWMKINGLKFLAILIKCQGI